MRQSWLDPVRLVEVGLGRVWQSRRGRVGLGGVWPGMARHGAVRQAGGLMAAVVIWRPEALTARLIARARPAAEEVAKAAQLRAAAASKRVAASIHMTGTAENFVIGANHPLGLLFEKGVRPHEIEPKKGVLRLADGSFVTGSIRHPGMASKPFLRPVLPLWAPLYRRSAAGAFRGF